MLFMQNIKDTDEAHEQKQKLRRAEKQGLLRYIRELLQQFININRRHWFYLTPALSFGKAGIQEAISLFSE